MTDITSATFLNVFGGTPRSDWHALDDALSDAELAALGGSPPRDGMLRAGADESVLTPDDDKLVGRLARDGRTSFAALASLGRPPRGGRRPPRRGADGGRHAVRLHRVAKSLLGFRTTATLWLTVAPSDLETVGSELADDLRSSPPAPCPVPPTSLSP